MITYDRNTFKNLKINNRDLEDSVKNTISKLVVKPCFINRHINPSHKTNSNSWRKTKPIIGKPIKNDIDKIKRNINSLLNKISKNNFNIIFKQIITNLKDGDDKLFNYVIQSIFEKSIIQPFYCPFYVKLYLELIKFNTIFKKMITDICNDYFDMIKYYKQKLKENIEDTSYDTFCLIIKNKNKKKGFSQFIGELYLKGIIDLDSISKIISILINNIKTILIDNELDIIENNIICLSELLNTIQSSISKIENIKEHLETIKTFSKNKNIIKRLQFMLMDLLDNVHL